MALYLTDKGFAEVQYVWGIRQSNSWTNDETHAWLEIGDAIIDITSDQFPDGPGPVVVTQDHSWHSQFRFQKRRPADFETYSKDIKADYGAAYREIVGHSS
jgi:hypothetical protein